MGFFDLWEPDTLVVLVFMLMVVSNYATGAPLASSPWVQSFAPLSLVPIVIFKSLVAAFPLAAPIFGVAVLAYFVIANKTLGPALMTLAFFASIVILLS